jgi:hypothetical protein
VWEASGIRGALDEFEGMVKEGNMAICSSFGFFLGFGLLQDGEHSFVFGNKLAVIKDLSFIVLFGALSLRHLVPIDEGEVAALELKAFVGDTDELPEVGNLVGYCPRVDIGDASFRSDSSCGSAGGGSRDSGYGGSGGGRVGGGFGTHVLDALDGCLGMMTFLRVDVKRNVFYYYI